MIDVSQCRRVGDPIPSSHIIGTGRGGWPKQDMVGHGEKGQTFLAVFANLWQLLDIFKNIFLSFFGHCWTFLVDFGPLLATFACDVTCDVT